MTRQLDTEIPLKKDKGRVFCRMIRTTLQAPYPSVTRTFQPRRSLCDRIVFSAERGLRPARQRESDHLALDAGALRREVFLSVFFLPFCLLIG